MCGISGHISNHANPLNFDAFMMAASAQNHRGPDAQGHKIINLNKFKIYFAHQRLSILDLSDDGIQPMQFNGNSLIFNGEIYNYLELKDELIKAGYSFSTSTDTEVINIAFHHWGIKESLQKFNGMWALAYFQESTGKVFLSRDRFGEKPLHYHLFDNKFYFASELKSLLKMVNKQFKLNSNVIAEYMDQQLMDSSNLSIFDGIYSLEPGTFSSLDLSKSNLKLESHDYWHHEFQEPQNFNEEDYICSLKQEFDQAIKIRLRSDVPIGILLSGGMDSSAIAASANEFSSNVKLISAVSDDKSFDESHYIDLVGNYLGKDVHKVNMDANIDELYSCLDEVNMINEFPIGSFSNISHYLLMKKAKDLGVTVILSGQGGDETFCGYKKFVGFRIFDMLNQKKYFSLATFIFKFLLNQSIINQFNFKEARRYLTKSRTNSMLTPEFSLRNPKYLGLFKNESINERQLRDLMSFSVPALNHYEDRISMSFSREIRLPFLDPNIVTFMLNTPPEFKMKDGWTKWPLRMIMRNRLPKSVVWRRDKQGFSMPQDSWISGSLNKRIRYDYLDDNSLIFKNGILDKKKVIQKFNNFTNNPSKSNAWYREIFCAIALESWLRQYKSFVKF